MPLGERRNRSLPVLAAGLVLAGGLAACTNGEGAEPEPIETLTRTAAAVDPSGEPTAERPEVEKPVPPDAMAREDVAGAEAAAQYFLELYPYVYATGDLSEWKVMSDPECEFCRSVSDAVEELHGAGGWSSGGQVTLESVEGFDRLEGNSFYRVDILASQEESIEYDSGGTSTNKAGSRNLLIFAVGRAGDSWSVRGVQVEAPDFEVQSDA